MTVSEIDKLNEYLVTIFNEVLIIEESELQRSQFRDISVKEVHTIDAIGLYHKKTSSEVAQELMVTVGTLTVAVNNLEKKGYVERIRSEDDRRVVKLGLTHKGKLVYRVHQHFHREMISNVLKGMSKEEGQTLAKALQNLHDFLEEFK